MSTLLNLDELDPTTTGLLPTPPHGEGWSIVTLAAHLAVPPAVAFTHLDDSDLRADRIGHSFDGDGNWSLGDCWLHPTSAERVAALYPAAVLARLVVADPALLGQVERIGGPALYALAKHLVDFAGGAA